VLESALIANSSVFTVKVEGNFAPAQNTANSAEAIRQAFAKTGNTNFKLRKLDIENKENLFTPVSMLNELRRKLYEQIKSEIIKTELPLTAPRQKSKRQPEFIIKTDKLENLSHLDLKKFAEIIYLLEPQSDLSGLAELPKNKIRIALPAVCRQPRRYQEIICRLLAGGYNKWQVANYWGLEVLPLQRLDICFDTSLYMLNTQAIAEAQKCHASRIALSLEDIKANILELLCKSSLPTELVIYQDIPLFTGVGCLRDNDCAHCSKEDKWFTLQRNGHRYKTFSHNCQTMVFDADPYCLAAEASDLNPDFFRLDFCYFPYTAETVAETVNKILKFSDVTTCIKGNFYNNNI